MVKDSATGQMTVSPTTLDDLTGAGPFDFSVGIGGQSIFNLAYDLQVASRLTVLVNGTEVVEGGSDDYTRDASGNRILFNYTVPNGALVRVVIG